MLRSFEDSPLQATPSRIFAGVRFLLLGFSPSEEASVRSKLLSGGGVDAGEYGPRCTHLIVDKIVYDDSECVIARNDGKTVVTALWVEHCLDQEMLIDTSSVLYRPVKDLNGIPEAKSMSICLTGYQRHDRDDIMKMVGLMGAYFSKPLVANKVTHLICYKFEGEKYELAKKLKKIKLVNHRWLEDCLKAWEILPECNYSKSGYELEMMEAEAKDSEEETEEDKTYTLFGGNVAAEPSNLHSGSGVTIPKESEVSFSIDKDEAAKKDLSDKMQDDVNGKKLVKSPRKAVGNEYISELQEVNRNQHELTGHVTQIYDKAICGKESSELLSNSREALPSDAMTPNAISYSRKPPRRSPASKLSGMFSSKVPGIPNGVSEPSNVKDSFNVSPPKLEQLKDNTDFGTVKYPDSELKLQSEGGSKRLQKRKISASNVSSKSPKTDVNSKPYASGTPFAGVNNDGLLINRSETVSGSPVFDAFKVPSDLMMSDKTPETSGLSNFKSSSGLSNSKSTIGARNEDKEMCSLTHLLSDNVTDPGVDQPNTIISSVKAGNCENDKPASPVNLGADNRSKKEVLSRSVTKKKVVKKTLGSKSRLISGSSKQKGSLCLNEKSLSDDDMFSREKSQEAEDVKDDIAGQAIRAEPTIVNEVTENKGFDNKVLNDVAVEDDETEAPEEDTGAELANAANDEMAELIPQANAVRGTKLKAELSSAMKMKRDIVHKKDTIEISEKAEPTIVGVTKSDEVGGLKLKDGMDKGKNDVSSKKKKNAAAVVRKTEKSGKGRVAELKEFDDVKMEVKSKTGIYVVRKREKSGRGKVEELKEIGDAKMEVKKKTEMQRPASKLKSKSISLGETELPTNGETDNKLVEEENLMQAELKKTVDDSKVEVKKSGMHRSANKLKNKSIALGETEVSKNAETDNNKLVEEEDLMQGRKYASSKGKMTLQRNVKKAEVTAEIEMGELANGDGGALETENANEVQRPTTKPKSKTVSAVRAQKCMEEEGKENKPVETGSVFANSSKPKESISAKLNRALRQTDNSVRVTKAHQKISARVSKVVKPEPVCFILSGHRLQRKEFQQIIRRMKGRVCRDSHNWSYEATHFVVPDPIRRTEKFFAAAASGRWILKMDYLTASNQEGKFLPEEPYEWFKKGFNEDGAINLEAPRKWRLLRERTGHGAFYGMRIIVYGECIAPPLDTLKRAVKAGDGVILATAPPYTRYLNSGVDFAVVCPGMPCVDSWVQEFLRHEIPCVSADYLVEYVCKPGCSLERHVLFKTEAWADKSYANLISRSEEVLEDLTSLVDGDEDGNNNSGSDDVSCQICGSRERAEVMLICGDETGSLGCGIGTHIDCCDPPLDSVPEEDWFCPKCYEARNGAHPKKKTKKEPRSSKRK